MSKKANPTTVGGFVLGAVVLMVAAVFLFGGGRLFRDTETFVAYFEGSLAGLDVGAPVTFRGVRIGSVTEILSVYNIELDQFYLPVVFEIEGDHFTNVGDPAQSNLDVDPDDGQAFMNHLFENGLRATLNMRSFVTGQLNVELDTHPGTPMELKNYPAEYPEFPTIPSGIQRITATARRILEKLQDVPIEEIVTDTRDAVAAIEELAGSEDLRAAIAGADKLINSPDLAASIVSLRSALGHFDDATQSAARVMDAIEPEAKPIVTQLQETSDKLQAALDEARNAVASFEESVAEDSDLRVRTTQAMEEVQRAARSIRILSELLERHPEALLRGKRGAGGGE
jgi:paraquat-inducible protein B